MYMTPQPYKCDRCGHEMQWSMHDQQKSPVFDDGGVCPVCWERFVRENCGILRYNGPNLGLKK